MRCKMMKIAGWLFTALYLCTGAGPVHAQGVSPGRLELSAAAGARGAATRLPNLLGESIRRFDRSLEMVYAQLAYRKDEHVTLRLRYTNGYHPDDYILAGLDRPQRGLTAGASLLAGPYMANIEYGYYTSQDSLTLDVLHTTHRFRLPNGWAPGLATWIGNGNYDRFEWLVRAGLVVPAGQHFALEPIVLVADDGVYPEPRTHAGLNAHVSLLEKGRLVVGFARRLDADSNHHHTALLFTGSIPVLQRHRIELSIRQTVTDAERATLITLGMALGIGSPE